MRLIEISTLDNGAHRNQTIDVVIPVLDGWAILPDDMETPNFPFGDITVDETQTPPVVTGWTAGTIPEQEKFAPAQLREEAYNTQTVIPWDGDMLTVTEASQKWQYYAAEGSTDKRSYKTVIAVLAVAAVLVGGVFSLFASSNPDGLEWSLFGNEEAGYSANLGLDEDDYGYASDAAAKAEAVQEKTSFLPDYAFSSDAENPAGTSVSGLVGSAMVAAAAVLICLIGGYFRKHKNKKTA